MTALGMNAEAKPFFSSPTPSSEYAYSPSYISSPTPGSFMSSPTHPGRRGNKRGGRSHVRPGQDAKEKPPPALVVTPWYAEGVEKDSISLSDELRRLGELTGLTANERNVRAAAVDRIREAAAAAWGAEVEVEVYGSHASGLAAPSSAVDVSVSGCGPLVEEVIRGVAVSAGNVKSILCEASSGFVQVNAPEATLNVLFSAEPATETQASSAQVKGWLAEFPAVAEVLAGLRQVLAQTGNLDVSTGGISAYCLLSMIVACARTSRPGLCSGDLLTRFCQVYGNEWDFGTASVSPACGLPLAKAHPAEQMSVVDPLNPTNNLAADCTRLYSIRAQLQHCAAALGRWVAPENNKNKRGYRGKTPLSCILSHQALLKRHEEIAAQKLGVMDAVQTLPAFPVAAEPMPPALIDDYMFDEDEEEPPMLIDPTDLDYVTPQRNHLVPPQESPQPLSSGQSSPGRERSLGDSLGPSSPSNMPAVLSVDSLADLDLCGSLCGAAGVGLPAYGWQQRC